MQRMPTLNLDLLPYEDFKQTETIQYGSAATSASANRAPLFIKEELNKLQNYVKIKFSEEPLEWDARKTYKTGDVAAYNGIVYIANADNGNQTPPGTAWDVFDVASQDLSLKYVGIDTDTYVALQDRAGSKTMAVNGNNTSAIMTPKNGLIPWDNGTNSKLGTASKKFNDIFSVNAHLTDITSGNITSTTGTISTLSGTTAVFDVFDGISSSARYADIAEKYKSDIDYKAGTVIGINEKSENNEITEYKKGMKAVGVVSTAPGYKLNSAADGIYIALKGRVPCKINGSAKKGQYIIADDNGCGVAIDDYTFEQSKLLLGIALENGTNVVEIKV